MPADEVDRIVGAWQRERPELDFAPLEVWSRVHRLARHLQRARRAAFAAGGLEAWEFDVVAALRRTGPPYQLSPTALMQHNLVSSGTMTNRIDRLAERGLVDRRTDPTDGRGILVVLTDAGKARVDEAMGRLVTIERELLAGLARPEQERLAALLRKLSVAVE